MQALEIFHDIFDTDSNDCVDAYELMVAFVLLCKEPLAFKLDYIFSLYDFNSNGGLTIDELAILIRTVTFAASKIDPMLNIPPITRIEALVKVAFDRADRNKDSEITKEEWRNFCLRHPMPQVCKYFTCTRTWEVF